MFGQVSARFDESNLPNGCATACFVDVETTGLSPEHHEVIEVALVLFHYKIGTGEILGIIDEYAGLRQPSKSIPAAASARNNITDAMVRGQRLDLDRIERIVHRADFLIAHNATFDRSFLSKLSETAKKKQWRCSMNGVSWSAYGFSSRGLQSLLAEHRFSPGNAHRALADVYGALALLGQLDMDGSPYFKELLRRRPLSANTVRPEGMPLTDPANRGGRRLPEMVVRIPRSRTRRGGCALVMGISGLLLAGFGFLISVAI